MIDVQSQLREALAGRYTIDGELGRGGMAIVFLGVDLRHQRQVAVKVLRPELATDKGAARFAREIQTAASLVHPHIIPLLDSGDTDDLAYLVMPYIEGETLRSRLFRDGPLSVDDALAVADDVAGALAYAHDRGCIHRDIKPENILLSGRDAFVADFGLARAIDVSMGERLSSTGLIMGTPAYMSPEQASGAQRLDGRSDIYALGCVVFEMFAGEPPFDGRTDQAVLARQMFEQTPSLRSFRPEVPERVVRAVETALQKTPVDRFRTAADFAAALRDDGAGPGRPRSVGRSSFGWRDSLARHWRSAVVAVGLVAAGIVAAWRLGGPIGVAPYAVENARQQFIVFAHPAGRASPEERALGDDAADELTRLLTGWDEARAVGTVSRAGLAFDLGLAIAGRRSLRESMAIARQSRVGTLVTLTATVRGDSGHLQAQLFDVQTERESGDPIASAGPRDDLFALVAPLAATILDVSGAPSQLRPFQRESRSLGAIRQLQEGRRSLERWQLERAERQFRASLETDSTYARAHHLLAMTLYWQAARAPQRFPELGGEIRRHAGAARRHGASLVHRDSLSVEAFFAFQNGDYVGARARYRELVRTDSTDTYAWLLLGSVEYQDVFAERAGAGAWRPRGNWNAAMRAFTKAIRLSPDFSLGYGHLFDIYGHVLEAAVDRVCYAFEPPGDVTVLIWETRDPKRQVQACPVMGDSIEWADGVTLAGGSDTALTAGAARLYEAAMIELERWTAYAPGDARPREELATWLLARAEAGRRMRSADGVDSLTGAALAHLEGALALKADTTPDDLARLGSLYLTTGDVARAVDLSDRAVTAAGDGRTLPMAAANPYLAAGRLDDALAIAMPISRNQRITVPDPEGDRAYDVLVEEDLMRLQVYGAVGLAGPRLREVFASVEDRWTSAGYDERIRGVLRRALAGWVWPALVAEPSAATGWLDGWAGNPAVVGLTVLPGDSGAARALLGEGLREAGADPSAHSAYVTGLLAHRLGRHQVAVEALVYLDGAFLDAQTLNPMWGMRSLAHLWRGAAYEALVDTDAARRHYRVFSELWADADSELQPHVAHARGAAARLR